MSEQQVDRRLAEAAEAFAYFARTRNYQYLDALSNAIDRTTALQALYDAERDYKSSCIDRRDKCCPEIDNERLRRSFDALAREIAGRDGVDLIEFLRAFAVQALSKGLEPCQQEEEEGEGQASTQPR